MEEELIRLLRGFADGTDVAEDAANLRKTIMDEMEAAVAFTDSFQIYEYALNRVERRFVEGLPVPEGTDADFADQLTGFVAVSKETSVMNRRIQDIIGQLPVRFTRQKYYSMVQEALTAYVGSDRESLEQVMYLLKTSGMASLSEEQLQSSPELAGLLEALNGLSFKEMTADEYRKAQDQITLAGEKLFLLSDCLQLLQDLVNDLYVLCLTKKDAVRDADMESTCLGILRDIGSLYEAGERAIPEMLEHRLAALEGVQESYFEKYLRMDPAPEYREGEDETALTARQVERLLSGSPFVSLEESGRNESGHGAVERGDVEKAMKAYVEVMDPILRSVQKPVMRAIMATSLSSLPVCFNSLDEISTYIKNSLESCTDRAEKETCMELLQQLMESEEYALV